MQILIIQLIHNKVLNGNLASFCMRVRILVKPIRCNRIKRSEVSGICPEMRH